MMNENKKPKQEPETRKQYILDHAGQLTHVEIARDMGVTRAQISRDVRSLKDSGEWDEWLENELIRLHLEADIDDVTRYREIAKLYARTITQRREIETKADFNIIFKSWRPNVDAEDDPDQLLPT